MEEEVDGATHLRRAEDALRAGDPMSAAAHYAAAGDAAPFEATALGFLDKGQDDALALYLRSRLDAADPTREPETVTKLAAWLVDLHVSRVCGAESGTVAAQNATKDLRLFIAAHWSSLDIVATRNLLEEYRLFDDLAHFLETAGAVRESVDLRLTIGDVAGVLRTLRQNNKVSPEDIEQVLPRAFRTDPIETSFFLRSRTLVAKLGGEHLVSLVSKIAIGILSEPLDSDNDDESVKLRKAAVALLQQVEYVTAAAQRKAWRRVASNAVCFGFGAAFVDFESESFRDSELVRSAEQAEQVRVREDAELDAKMLAEMKCTIFETNSDDEHDADSRGNLANAFQALAFENKNVTDERVASAALSAATSHAVSGALSASDKTTRAKVAESTFRLVNESGGDVTTEFVLRCLPDTVTVDEVRDATLAELARHASRASECRDETTQSTNRYEALLNEILEKDNEEVKMRWNEPCCVCGEHVNAVPTSYASFAAAGKDVGATLSQKSKANTLSPMYAFPCGMAFHNSCLLEQALPMMSRATRSRVLDLLAITRAPLPKALRARCKEYARVEKNAQAKDAESAASDSKIPPHASASKRSKNQSSKSPVTQLEDLLCEECPFCGLGTINMIDKPFIGDDEQEEVESWRIAGSP
jgi:hypothetical protein